jgi:hypothetical protein
VESQKERERYEDLDAGERILFKPILGEMDEVVWMDSSGSG